MPTLEIPREPFRHIAQSRHEVRGNLFERLRVFGRGSRTKFRLEIPVQDFIGIDFGRVGRKIENLDGVSARIEPQWQRS